MNESAGETPEKPDHRKPFALRWPRATAFVLAPFTSVQMFGVGAGLLQTAPTLEDHRAEIIGAGLVTAIIGAIAAYTVVAHLLGATKPLANVRASGAVLLAFLAFLSGQIATLITFGNAGPWGHIVKGISGPLTDGVLNGVVSSA